MRNPIISLLSIALGLLAPTVVHAIDLYTIGETRIDDIPAFTENGSAEYGGGSVAWQIGDTASSVLPVGILTDFSVQDLTLQHIGQHTGLDPNQQRLDQFEPIQFQTIKSLTDAIPGLRQRRVSDIGPIRDALPSLGQRRISDILARHGSRRLANLTVYTIGDIPGLDSAPLKGFQDIDKALIRGIPGLSQLPFKQYPVNLGVPTFARIGVIYDDAETNRQQTITGGNNVRPRQADFNVACDRPCSYLELENTGPFQFHGQQLIAGDTQKVLGGWGVLPRGPEPTGLHPWGPAFKYSIGQLDSASGRGQSYISFRYCQTVFGKKVGCTPYWFGPFPVPWNLREKGYVPTMGVQTLQPPTQTSSPATPTATPSANPEPPLPKPTTGFFLPSGSSPDSIDEPNALQPEPVATPATTCGQPGLPTANRFRISSPYGRRRRPCQGCSGFHGGTDLATPYRTRLLAMQSGKVTASRIRGRNGLYISIKGCDNHRVLYLHMDESLVKVGQSVKKGQLVGYSGGGPPSPKARRGSSTGNHLHIHVYTAQNKVMNPERYRQLR